MNNGYGRSFVPEELETLQLSHRGERLVGHARGPIPPPLFPSDQEAAQREEF
eukprot:SAG31_NODE_5708_length_2369_cov_2.891630_4_plen_51_part_01